MIIDVKELTKISDFDGVDEAVLQMKLDAIEELVRAYTNNNFQNRKIRFSAPSNANRIDGWCEYIREGDTIQITDSINDGLYVVKKMKRVGHTIELDKELFDVNDSVDTSVSYGAGDLLCSVAGKKPISGKLGGVGSKTQFETMANNIGSGWHLNTIKAESANQLLMMIELGRFNTQAAIGQGVVSCPSNGSYNCSSYTGATASLGNATGMATETTYESAGTETVNTTNGKLSVTYRGVENPWGNIWKHTNGINLWGDGHMGAGQVFIADDFSFNESKHDGNYKPTGFTISNANGYMSAFGYGDEEYDWLFMPSETAGNNSVPVGDYYWCTPNLNGYRIARLGGGWAASVIS